MNVAIARGHWGNSGAEGVDGFPSECEYNNRLVELIKENAPDWLNLYVHDHKIHGYTERERVFHEDSVGYFGKEPDLAVELHYNSSSNPKAEGFEYLCYNSERSKEIAHVFADMHHVTFPKCRPRRDRGVGTLSSGENGYGFLIAFRCPAILAETFFGSNPEEFKIYLDHMPSLARSFICSFACVKNHLH